MIHIYDQLSNKFLYVNQNHIIHVSDFLHVSEFGAIEMYKVYLTNGKELLIDRDGLNRILEEM